MHEPLLSVGDTKKQGNPDKGGKKQERQNVPVQKIHLRNPQDKVGDQKEAKEADKALTQDDGLQANERSLVSELAAEKARKDAKDILLEEAAHILGDEVDLLKTNRKLAERVISEAMRKVQTPQR